MAFIVHMPFQVAEKGAETKGPSFVPTICIKGDGLPLQGGSGDERGKRIMGWGNGEIRDYFRER